MVYNFIDEYIDFLFLEEIKLLLFCCFYPFLYQFYFSYKFLQFIIIVNLIDLCL